MRFPCIVEGLFLGVDKFETTKGSFYKVKIASGNDCLGVFIDDDDYKKFFSDCSSKRGDNITFQVLVGDYKEKPGIFVKFLDLLG